MKYLISILFLIPFYANATHDVPVANFTLTFSEKTMFVEMEFDQEDMDKVIEINYARVTTSDLIKKYLSANTVWLIDLKEKELNFTSIETQNGHYLVKAECKINGKVKNIQLQNTCFIKEIEDHSNVLLLNYNDNHRGFRLHKDRTQTNIEL